MAERKVHPIFYKFERFHDNVDGVSHYDFLGVRTNPKFWKGMQAIPPGRHLRGYPQVGEQYFEWVFLAETVWACRDQDSFSMVELGAGYGPWMLRAHHAFRQLSKGEIFFIGVEGDFNHYEWMIEHFSNNDLDPKKHRLLNACVSDSEGVVSFTISDTPDSDYGLKAAPDNFESHHEEKQLGEVLTDERGHKYRAIPSVTLDSLIEDRRKIDLVHMDIEGHELRVVDHSMHSLNEKAARLLIGTHSREIEIGLRALLADNGWNCVYDFDQDGTTETEWGKIQFRNGCQAWTNPRYVEASK
ncbi:FkbM family methyltransferase [Myxococcota bacterium]|nr:FkbM family methyltransferase [Myxococcota bacterium]